MENDFTINEGEWDLSRLYTLMWEETSNHLTLGFPWKLTGHGMALSAPSPTPMHMQKELRA